MYPTLNTNEIYGSLQNMIISQTVFGNPIENEYGLLEENRVDGGLYGDTKTFTSTDVGKSYKWGADEEAANLLKLARPTRPKVQAIEVNQFRQIAITVDNYLSKRAWTDEGKFSEFNSIILQWLGLTKDVYENTYYNTCIGTEETSIGKQQQLYKPVAGNSPEENNRLYSTGLAEKVANIITSMKDYSRDFNDNGFLRSYKSGSIKVIWVEEVINKIKKVDLPTIYNKEDLDTMFGGERLPRRYFGTINASGGTTLSDNKNIRSLIEVDYNSVEQDDESYDVSLHIFPGDLLPNNKKYGEYETYTEDDTILCKITVANSLPMMSAFSTNTAFFNARSLTETQFLTWGYSVPQHLKEKPFVTLREDKAKAAEAKTKTSA